MDHLIDFSASEETELNTFAGTVTYSTEIEHDNKIKYIKLSEVNEAVTELVINGERVGIKWYGNHEYDVSPFLTEGTNKVEIILTTTLANYCRSLIDNPTAKRWAGRYKTPFPSGLEGIEFTE
jgi:hypothetical protein